MKNHTKAGFSRFAAVILALASSTHAWSFDRPATAPDVGFDVDPGLACASFKLRIEIWATASRVDRTFKDKNGNTVRLFEGGRGNTLALTNLTNGKSQIVPPTGSVTHTVVNADGSLVVRSTGNNVVIFFPTDIPAGPSTKLYVGNLTYQVSTTSVFSVESTAGRQVDICAALQ